MLCGIGIVDIHRVPTDESENEAIAPCHHQYTHVFSQNSEYCSENSETAAKGIIMDEARIVRQTLSFINRSQPENGSNFCLR